MQRTSNQNNNNNNKMKLYENVIFTQARYPQILPQFPLVFWFLRNGSQVLC